MIQLQEKLHLFQSLFLLNLRIFYNQLTWK
jgi:hypothetical protein